NPIDVDEDSPISLESCHPYGRNRLRLELAVRDRFPDVTILRLPGLFGQGLKKNIIFDLMNHNQVDRVHAEAVFQFYNLDHLSHDVERARAEGIVVLNVATEPISVREVARQAFG